LAPSPRACSSLSIKHIDPAKLDSQDKSHLVMLKEHFKLIVKTKAQSFKVPLSNRRWMFYCYIIGFRRPPPHPPRHNYNKKMKKCRT
jgi:hypothetical protein